MILAESQSQHLTILHENRYVQNHIKTLAWRAVQHAFLQGILSLWYVYFPAYFTDKVRMTKIISNLKNKIYFAWQTVRKAGGSHVVVVTCHRTCQERRREMREGSCPGSCLPGTGPRQHGTRRPQTPFLRPLAPPDLTGHTRAPRPSEGWTAIWQLPTCMTFTMLYPLQETITS